MVNPWKKSYDQPAAASAKSLQSCPTLCDPIDGKPTRLPHPWDSPGKNTGMGCHFLLLDSILKIRDITLPTKVHLVKAMVFPVIMYGCEKLEYEESWEPKNWCFWTMVLEKTLESPLDCKEIQPVHSKGYQSWVFIDVKVETPILWPPDGKSWLIWKDPDAGKDWRQEEKGMTEDEMVGWHHRLNGHEFE